MAGTHRAVNRPPGPWRYAPPRAGAEVVLRSSCNVDRPSRDLTAMGEPTVETAATPSRDAALLAVVTRFAPAIIVLGGAAGLVLGLVAIAHGGVLLMFLGAGVIVATSVVSPLALVVVLHVRVVMVSTTRTHHLRR